MAKYLNREFLINSIKDLKKNVLDKTYVAQADMNEYAKTADVVNKSQISLAEGEALEDAEIYSVASVNGLFDKRKLTTYTAFSQIGITDFSTIESLTQFVDAMDTYSYLMASIGTTNATILFNKGILPVNLPGIIEINKSARVNIIYTIDAGIKYSTSATSAGAAFKPWKEFATQENLDLKQNSNSALKYLYSTSITSASTTSTATPNFYIRIDGIPTDYTGSTRVKSWKIRTRYNHTYELVLTPWNNEGTNADRVLRLLATEGTSSNSCTVDCAYKFSSGTEDITMSIIFKITARSSATPFRVANLVSETADADNYVWTRLGNDTATVTLEDGSTMNCADYYATFTPCQKTQMATMDNLNEKADKNAVLNSLEVVNGNHTAQIVPWTDGTHYRGFEDKGSNTYTDIITKGGVASIAKIENGAMTKLAELATMDKIAHIPQRIYAKSHNANIDDLDLTKGIYDIVAINAKGMVKITYRCDGVNYSYVKNENGIKVLSVGKNGIFLDDMVDWLIVDKIDN